MTLAIIALFTVSQEALALYYYGGNGDGSDVAMGANVDLVTISSAADQTFVTSDSTTAISTLTITQDVGQAGGGINTTSDIRVKIPTSLDMTWDTTDTSATIAGSASSKVSATVSYPDSKTLLIDVTTNFANGDYITVSGLSFKNFNSIGFSNLTLYIDGGATVAATDDKKKTISLPASSATFTGGNGDGFAIDSNIRYWVASADGNWNDTANWSDTSGGASGFSVPSNGQVAVFDSGSTKQCTVNLATVSLLDLIMASGYTGASAKIITNGNLTLAGVLNVTGGTLDISTNTNTLTTTGTLTVDGGTLTATNGNIDANGAVVVSSGTLTAPTTVKSFTVAVNFTHSAGTFTHSSGTVTLDGTNQTISGSTTFYNLTKSVTSAATLTFDNTATQTITNSLTLQGASGQLLSLRSDAAAAYNLTLQAGGTQSLSYLDVQYADASGGVMLAGGATSTNSGNNTNWAFDGTTVTWDGSSSTNWDTAANWDLGVVPRSTDTVVIADVTNDPLLDQARTVGALTINSGGVLSLNGFALTVTNALTNNGTLNVPTAGTPFSAGSYSFAATSTTNFTGVALDTAVTIPALTYGIVTVNNSGTTFTLAGNTTIGGTINVTGGTLDISTTTLTTTGTLTIDGGTLTATNGNIDANGAVVVSSGTLTAPTTAKSFTVAGNFTHSGGTFTHSSGTVTLDTSATSILSGSTTFNNFTCATAGKQLTFTAGTTQTISGTLTLTGTSANKIILRSSSSGSTYTITDSGTEAVSFVNVQDSIAANSIIAYNSTNSGNNTNWTFSNLSVTYPATGKTTGQTPTVIGTANASDTLTIKDISSNTVATTTADSSGNFRVAVSTSLATGANSLTPYVGSVAGSTVNLTIVASPTTDQVPTITSPAASATIRGNKPTITGKGLAGQTVTLTAKDANGNLLLTDVASTTVGADGNYTISSSSYTTNLVKGTNYLTVTVDSVTSGILEVSLVDPFGVLFDSVSNNPVKGATVTIFTSTGVQCTPGVQIAATDSNPQTTGADGLYSFLTINGDFYITVSASGYNYPSTKTSFPSGRTIVTGSKGEIFTVAGVVIEMDHPMDSNDLLLKVKKDANKKNVTVGDIVTYTVTIQNPTSSDVTNVYLEDKIPAGFKYISGKAILDNIAISDPTGDRPLTFNIGTVTAGQTRTLKYQLVVGSGVSFGNYENTAFAKYSDGTVISNNATETVKVVPDPLFDLGTVIGKVFWDKNENGIQDKGEETIPNAQIATEEGTLITTDKDGKYHLQAIIPGRHIFRLDERTLPEGSYLTTDKAVIVDITPGILAKVNFGVRLPAGVVIANEPQAREAISLTQDKNRPTPRLNAALYKDEIIKDASGKLLPSQFRIFTNYSLFIDKWKLEILDRDTKALVKKFEGASLTLNEPIYWDGYLKSGKQITDERNYVYLLTVTGKDGRQDLTKERKLIVREEKTENRKQESEKEIEREKQKWIEQESKVNNLDRQNIKIEGETIKVNQLAGEPIASVKILKSGKLEGEISVVQSQGIAPSSVLESPQSLEKTQSEVTTDIILPKGEYDIQVMPLATRDENKHNVIANEPQAREAISKEEMAKPQAYAKHIKVGEDYLFFVGMGDAKMGYTFNRGNIEPAGSDDKFREGFWAEGKLAYYLKGKIKGKYLITSSLDTKREKKELFKNLDPNKYYPVYGDASSVNYDATNTQGPLYLLIEWDKSSVLWGDYNTALSDTEFAQFNRTLYGGKINYESVSATQFGEPRTKLIVFKARAKQKAAHNEFIGTGGSLFYLKNKDVIEGSDKVKIEVRDKITGLVLATKQMEGRVDYQINYSQGRLIFWKPVSQISESDSIISSQLLDGNPVYVVVDYEYETKDKYDEGNYGVRAQQSLTDYLRVGGTYVREEQLGRNYILKGTDTVIHLGKDVKFTGEYAQSESQALGSFISTDGGLNFTELATGNADKGKAYGLKGEGYLFGRLGLTGYYQQIERGFSSASTISQQGKELIGAAATIDLTSKTRLKVQHDIQKLIDSGNLQTQLQVGAQKTETTTAQITHEEKKLKLTGEYRHQQVTQKKEQFQSETNTEGDTAAVRADYKATEKVIVSLEQQATLKGTPNHQTSAGVSAEVNKYLTLRAKETVGNQGSATSVGAAARTSDKFELSGNLTRANARTGEISDTVSLGGKVKADDKTELHTTYAVTDSSIGGSTQSVVYGSKHKINDNLALSADKSYAKAQDKLIQANTYGLTKEKDGKKLEGTLTEQRSQSNTEVSNTNIFGLSGDINDKWAAQGSFERGIVQNHDGTQATRNAGSAGLGYLNKDPKTGEVRLKASSKLELRLDNSQENKRQYLAYNAIEGKINPNTTLFAKANISQTKNTTTNSTEAQYKELVTGAAYRPVNFDRLNLLGRYTYLEDNSPSGQTDFKDIEKEKSHTLAGEAVYDLTDKWQLVEKLAYKMGEEKVAGFDFTKTQTWLMVHRLNYNLNKDWQVGGEYRRLTQKQAKDYKQGVLVEAARKIGDFLQVGVGYNFTNFNDDLTHLNYTAQGPFVRLTGKFYDRTPEEIERARQKWLEQMIKLWAGELVNDELARPDSPIMQELYKYFYAAENLRAEGRLKESEKLYEKILQIGNIMYQEAEVYVRKRIELEKSLKENNRLALAYYKEGKLQEAKALWQKLIKEAEPVPIHLEF
ncbi:MAG: SdrD B-like domain-containing protein [bacterium]|nr:SdrD B-like domain-containing protein [bacterium]